MGAVAPFDHSNKEDRDLELLERSEKSPQFVAKHARFLRQYWLAALVDALCIFLRQPDAEIGGREVCRTLVGRLQELIFFQDLKFLPNPNPCEMLR